MAEGTKRSTKAAAMNGQNEPEGVEVSFAWRFRSKMC